MKEVTKTKIFAVVAIVFSFYAVTHWLPTNNDLIKVVVFGIAVYSIQKFYVDEKRESGEIDSLNEKMKEYNAFAKKNPLP